MNNRKMGHVFMGLFMALGLLGFAGTLFWVGYSTNWLLGVFVFILYSMGQWLVVGYWQQIQNDWEGLAQTFIRMENTFASLPRSIEENFQGFSGKLEKIYVDGLRDLQQKALEGNRQALAANIAQIETSITKGFAAPAAALTRTVEDLREGLSRLREGAEADLRRAAEESARREAAAHQRAQELLGAVKAEAEKARAEMQGREDRMHGLFEERARLLEDRERERAEREGEAKEAAEAEKARVSRTLHEETARLRDGLLESLERMQKEGISGFSAAAETLAKGFEESARAQHAGFRQDLSVHLRETLEGLLERWTVAGDTLSRSFAAAGEELKDSTDSLTQRAALLFDEVEERAVKGNAATLRALMEAQQGAFSGIEQSLLAQAAAGEDLEAKVRGLSEGLSRAAALFEEGAQLLQSNQAEMQAGVALLTTGLGEIVDRLERKAAAGEEERDFLSRLHESLASFHERAGEVLVENALKTQEILLEVLPGAGSRNGTGSHAG